MKLRAVFKFLRYLLLPVGLVIGIATLSAAGAFAFLVSSAGNKWLRESLENYLTKKLDTSVKIGEIHFRNLNHLTVFKFSLLDHAGNQLLAFERFSLSFQWNYWWKSKQTFLNDLQIKHLTSKIERGPESKDFNFQFLLDAFSSPSGAAPASPVNTAWLVPASVKLEDIVLKYRDGQTEDSAGIAIGRLNASLRFISEIRPADWTLQKMVVDSAVITLFSTNNKRFGTTSADSVAWAGVLHVGDFKVLRSSLHYVDASRQRKLDLGIGQLHVVKGTYAYAKSLVHADRIVLKDHFSDFHSGEVQADRNRDSSKPSALDLSVDTLLVSNNRIAIELHNRKKSSGEVFDPFHNDFKNINTTVYGFHYLRGTVTARLRQLALQDAKRFRIRDLNVDFTMGAKALVLRNLSLLTLRNQVNGGIIWRYSSLARALADPQSTFFNIAAKAESLNLREVSYFLPNLLVYQSIYPLYEQNIRATVQASGSPRAIALTHLDLSTSHNHLRGKGEIHIPTHQPTWLVLNIKEGYTGKKGLLEVISPKVLSTELLGRTPASIQLDAKVKITSQSIQGIARLKSAAGQLRLKGLLSNFSELDKITYNLTFEASDLHLGEALKDTLWGKITANGNVKGAGLNGSRSMALESSGYADKVEIAGKQIESVCFDAHMDHGRLQANLASANDDLNFELSPTIYFNRPDSLGLVKGWVHNLNLQKLGLTKDSIQIGGWISANLAKFSADTLMGSLSISSGRIQLQKKIMSLDELTLDASHPGDQQVFQLKSPVADLDLSGRFTASKFPDFIRGLARSVFQSEPFPSSADVASFAMHADIHVNPDLLLLTPDVSQLSAFSFSSDYEKDTGTFNFQTRIDSLKTGDVKVDSLFTVLHARQNSETSLIETDYSLGARRILTDFATLPAARLNTRVTEGIHTGELTSSTGLFHIGFISNARQQNPFITLRDSVYFKNELWKVNPDNALFPFSGNLAGSRISVQSGLRMAAFTAADGKTLGLPYKIHLANINMGQISAFLKADSTFLTGSVSGDLSVNQLRPLALTARIDVDSLQLNGAGLGNLHTEVWSDSADRYRLEAATTDNHAILKASGVYEPLKSTGSVAVDLQSFPILPLSDLLGSEIDSLQGSLSGHLAITTTAAKTFTQGLVRLDSSSFDIRPTGSRIHLTSGGFAFDGQKVNIDPITLVDGSGGQAILTGSMDIGEDRNLSYRLKLDAKRFKTIDQLRRQEQLVYGSSQTDANLELTGDLHQFQLTGQVSFNDSAKIVYRNTAATRTNFGDGLLEFVAANQNAEPAKIATTSPLRRQINTNISAPSNAALTIVLDEYRGEKVEVRGKSNLNYAQHAGGEMQLNGKYEVSSGLYTFSVGNNIKRTFTLENGGTIQWTGDLYKPMCDLTAIYKVNTSAGALMQGTGSDAEAARKKFDFLVKLKLKGNLSKPDITFEVGMNETDQDAYDGAIYDKIKQLNNSQSEVTKQVMSLLVLNSFMGDSPFGSLSQLNNNAIEAGAYNTIGNVLTRQLNNMLAGMVKVIDITLGVNWSASMDAGRSSTRSDIKLGLGKSLFNHRLNLYVGNNFGVETLSGSNSGISGLANDVSVEYLLNPEGKYRIKGYHVRDNELTLHGEHMETGVKFTVIWEFDHKKVKRVHPRRR